MPIFRSRLQADLLAWLLLHPEQEFTMTELAQGLRVPLNTLHREALRLVDTGLLRARSVGRSRLLSANRGHRAVDPLTRLLEVTFGPRVVVAEEFARVPGVEEVVIFGSWAQRYEGEVGVQPNDVDVLFVGSVDRPDVYDAADRSQARMGLPVNPVQRSAEQWARGDDPLVSQVQVTAHLRVFPPEVGESA